MLKWILEHGEDVGVVTVVLVFVFMFLAAWSLEILFLGKTVRRQQKDHLRQLEDKDREIERCREVASRAEARSERLLSQLERAVGIAEEIAPAAASAVLDKIQRPEKKKP